MPKGEYFVQHYGRGSEYDGLYLAGPFPSYQAALDSIESLEVKWQVRLIHTNEAYWEEREGQSQIQPHVEAISLKPGCMRL